MEQLQFVEAQLSELYSRQQLSAAQPFSNRLSASHYDLDLLSRFVSSRLDNRLHFTQSDHYTAVCSSRMLVEGMNSRKQAEAPLLGSAAARAISECEECEVDGDGMQQQRRRLQLQFFREHFSTLEKQFCIV